MWRRVTVAAALAVAVWAADSDWLKQVEPILRPEEKAAYLSLSTEAERNAFAAAFWSSKRISAEEYFRRVAYIDANFGAGRFLSGARTDRGRVYLSLGAPQKVTRLVSSRIFYPIEIWYYDSVPAVGIPNSLHLLFYQKNGVGEYGLETPWSLAVGPHQASSEILVGEASENATANATPFQFGPLRLTPSENGRLALIQVTRPQLLTWRLSRGLTTVWRAVQPESEIPSGMAVQEIGRAELAPGAYQLEVTGEDFSKTATVRIGEAESAAVTISYNANLVADVRSISLGKQYLRRGMMREARRSFEQALALRDSDEARVNLARVSAREGDLQGARRRLDEVLDRSPNHFEALSSMGSIAAQLGDYPSAVRYYQRALAIQKSPILTKALSELMARMPQPTPR